ncbi:MAG: DUF2288 domain-containing protein [Luteolibacter sp.]
MIALGSEFEGLFGEDHFTTAEKLANYTGSVSWGYLQPHYERGALFFVDPGLKLEDVGEAIANDQSEKIKAWLASADLVKITELHAGQWKETPAITFQALVVSPFVLCRPE